MLVVVLSIVVTPMQARVERHVTVPRFYDVDLAFVGPLERFRGKHPEGRPDSSRAWRCRMHNEAATLSTQQCAALESGTCISTLRGIGAKNQVALMVERIERLGKIVLKLVIAPAMVAELVLKVL